MEISGQTVQSDVWRFELRTQILITVPIPLWPWGHSSPPTSVLPETKCKPFLLQAKPP